MKDEQSRTGQKEKLNCETENFFCYNRKLFSDLLILEIEKLSGLSPLEVVVPFFYIFIRLVLWMGSTLNNSAS